jgi:AICAR transformylase/IMP cyclohydrolase PurH
MPATEFSENFNSASRILTATVPHAQPTNVIYANNTTTGGVGVGQSFPPQMPSTTSAGHVIKMDAGPTSAVLP